MKRIKISCGDSAIASSDGSNPMITKFLPGRKNIWKNCEFFWNDKSVKKADYWFVIGDVFDAQESCEVDANNLILMTSEPPSIRRYDTSEEFVKQFGRIATCHSDFRYGKFFSSKPPINWWIDAGNPIKTQVEFDEWNGAGLGYDDFKKLREIKKEKLLSVFCSAKIFTEGHKARYDFCKKLQEHFKDKVDWFGSGVRPIVDKWDGVAPYKYHIALENFSGPNYWTEKLMDPLMVLTHPIYCGATNIRDFFSEEQVSMIDIRYPKTAIAKIEKLIEGNFYEKNLAEALKARDLVMDEYNLFNLITQITEDDAKSGLSSFKPQFKKIKKEEFFLPKSGLEPTRRRKNFLQRIKKSVAKKLKKLSNYFADYFFLARFRMFENS